MSDKKPVKKRKPKRAKLIRYTPAIAGYILDEIEKGRTLTDICKEDGIPIPSTVHKWVREDYDGFGEQYRRSREIQLNVFIDQMNDIADMPPPIPPEMVKNAEGKMVPLEGSDRKLWTNAEVQRRRLKIDTIKFQAAKLAGTMGYNMESGVTVQGDVVNILNYATEAPTAVPIDIPVKRGGQVKEATYIEVKQ